MFLCGSCHNPDNHFGAQSYGLCESCGDMTSCIDCHVPTCPPKANAAGEPVWAENPNTSIEQLVHRGCLTTDKERQMAKAAAEITIATTKAVGGVCARCNEGF